MPGRPRKTALQLLVDGTWRRDRHGSRELPPTAPLGPPPRHLGVEARTAWRETAASARWLCRPDRGLLEVYAQLLAAARRDFDAMSAAKLSLLASLGARLGLAPADRSRLTLPPTPTPPDPGEKFFTKAAK